MVSPNSTQNAILNRGFSLNIILPLNGFSHKSTCVNQTQLIKQIGSLLVRNCAEMELIKHLDWFRVLLVLTLGWANCPKTYGIAALQNQAKESKRQRRQRTFRHESKVDAAGGTTWTGNREIPEESRWSEPERTLEVSASHWSDKHAGVIFTRKTISGTFRPPKFSKQGSGWKLPEFSSNSTINQALEWHTVDP